MLEMVKTFLGRLYTPEIVSTSVFHSIKDPLDHIEFFVRQFCNELRDKALSNRYSYQSPVKRTSQVFGAPIVANNFHGSSKERSSLLEKSQMERQQV